MSIILLGLPGLYQNWLMAAVDPTSKVQLHGDQNFFCSHSRVKWVIKPGLVDYPVASKDLTVINLMVNQNNFPWYMYNLYEKTYDIKIMINNFAEDIINKGDQFSIFEDTKNDLLNSYSKVTNDTVMHYFYRLFSTGDHYLHTATQESRDNYINIEFEDFNHPDVLIDKLRVIEGFDIDHFNSMYTTLVARNSKYLDLRKNFLNRLAQNNSTFDIIETAYIGKLASLLLKQDLDWSKPAVRNSILKYKIKEIHDLARALC